MASAGDSVFAKAAWRLIPFLGLLYLANYLDRVNAGFAALTMNRDLGFSPAVFGFGGGVLFAGYLLFQVPANAVLLRFGARRWICCILLTWGGLSAATGFVAGPAGFYILRFLLGLAEAGLFPGVMYYLGLWFPQAYRARFSAAFVCAIPLSGMVGAPLSAAFLGMEGLAGLHGWQWLFLLEGLPACLLGLAVLKWLPDGPGQANWLDVPDREVIATRLRAERRGDKQDLWQALRDPKIIVLSAAGFAAGSALYGTSLWLPQMVSAMGFSNFGTSIVVALVYLAAMVMVVAWGYSSDRRGEQFRHVAFAWLIAAAGFALSSAATNNAIALTGLVFAVAGIPSAIAPYFTLPSTFLRGAAEAGGIATMNAIVSLGGFIGPFVIGILRGRTGNYSSGMAMLAVELVIAAAMVLALAHMTERRAILQGAEA